MISVGFSSSEREAVAMLFWQAFGEKLGVVLGPKSRALDYLGRCLSPKFVLVARNDLGFPVGIAGFQTKDGGFSAGTGADLAAVYGAFGAFWRGIALRGLHDNLVGAPFTLDGLSVAPTQQGRGIGTALLSAVEALATAQGHREIRLEIARVNTAAARFYERNGYRRIGPARPGWSHFLFPGIAADVLAKTLGDAHSDMRGLPK